MENEFAEFDRILEDYTAVIEAYGLERTYVITHCDNDDKIVEAVVIEPGTISNVLRNLDDAPAFKAPQLASTMMYLYARWLEKRGEDFHPDRVGLRSRGPRVPTEH